MSPETKSSTAIVAGQIASALIGFALGVVVTLLAVVDWVPAAPRPAATTPVPAAAIPAPSPATAPPATAGPVTPPEATATPAPAPVAVPPSSPPSPPPPPPPEQPAIAAAAPPAAVDPPVPVPATKPAKPKPKPKPAGPSPGRARFVVQAGAFMSDEIAGKVATLLTDHDHPAEVLVRTDDSGRVWNVVRLTELFASRGEAERTANVLKRDSDVDTLIIRLPPTRPEDAAKDGAAKTPDQPGGAEAPPP